MAARNSTKQAGFTLPELLVVGVTVLAFVAGMLILVRPANYDTARRDAERRTELAQIMQAIVAYKKATGQFPPHLTTDETPIANTDSDDPTLCNDLVPQYMDDLPLDPATGLRLNDTQACNATGQIFMTGYFMRVENGRVILSAPSAEGKETVTVERKFPLF